MLLEALQRSHWNRFGEAVSARAAYMPLLRVASTGFGLISSAKCSCRYLQPIASVSGIICCFLHQLCGLSSDRPTGKLPVRVLDAAHLVNRPLPFTYYVQKCVMQDSKRRAEPMGFNGLNATEPVCLSSL